MLINLGNLNLKPFNRLGSLKHFGEFFQYELSKTYYWKVGHPNARGNLLHQLAFHLVSK
jgi:hypothetical protein